MTRSGPHRMDMGKPDARMTSTLHCSEGDQLFDGPSRVAAQSKFRTRARWPPARVTAFIEIPAVSSRADGAYIQKPLRPRPERRTERKVPIASGVGIVPG